MFKVAKNPPKQSWHKSLLLAVLLAILGLMSLAIAPVARLEPDVGLKWLFNLRGPRPAPEQVVVVTIDRDSSRQLGLPNVPRKWPRELHADLILKLKAAGASVVSFDMIFTDHREPEQDKLFANAMRETANVVLFEYIQTENLEHQGDGLKTAVHLEKRLPPIPEFVQSALATAPFHLPKVPERVNQAWLFKSGSGDLATVPVVALHHHLAAYYPQLQTQITEIYDNAQIPDWLKQARPPANPADFARYLHQFFSNYPDLFITIYKNNRDTALAPLLYTHLHGQNAGIYLDFYGPARSVNTISYHEILEDVSAFDLTDKAIFVGFSERLQPEQKDGFFTAFTDNQGLDVSGVEIMATTFANLIEMRHIRPLEPPYNILLVICFGLLSGFLLYRLQGVTTVLFAIATAAAYLLLCFWLFSSYSLWLPLVIPLLIQLPFALVLALLAQYLLSHKEKSRLHHAFKQYVPEYVANTAAISGFDGLSSYESQFGVCLATDASDFTSRSEVLTPGKLHGHLNQYFEELFSPVTENNGMIVDVVGDAMLSAWIQDDAIILRESACKAAIEIQRRLKQTPENLPTRIGLHCGEVSMGNIGAGDHFEYRIVGDVVNTATRIEGLNKQLKTRILASEQTLIGLDNIASRNLGQFRLKGKQQALTIYEVFCEQPSDRLNNLFHEALDAFNRRQWDLALERFLNCLKNYPEDGPSQFFLAKISEFLQTPPPDDWDGVVNISQK